MTPTLADRRVKVATSRMKRAAGFMFRRSIPDDFALVMEYGDVADRALHMTFVPFDIDAVWLIDGTIARVERLSAWTGTASHPADVVVELPAGAASDWEEGQPLEVDT